MGLKNSPVAYNWHLTKYNRKIKMLTYSFQDLIFQTLLATPIIFSNSYYFIGEVFPS